MVEMKKEIEIKRTLHYAKMCECGRLYCESIDATGKMRCTACNIGCSVDELKKLWSIPISKDEEDE